MTNLDKNVDNSSALVRKSCKSLQLGPNAFASNKIEYIHTERGGGVNDAVKSATLLNEVRPEDNVHV